MWQCGIQSRKIVYGQSRREVSSTLQFTKHRLIQRQVLSNP